MLSKSQTSSYSATCYGTNRRNNEKTPTFVKISCFTKHPDFYRPPCCLVSVQLQNQTDFDLCTLAQIDLTAHQRAKLTATQQMFTQDLRQVYKFLKRRGKQFHGLFLYFWLTSVSVDCFSALFADVASATHNVPSAVKPSHGGNTLGTFHSGNNWQLLTDITWSPRHSFGIFHLQENRRPATGSCSSRWYLGENKNLKRHLLNDCFVSVSPKSGWRMYRM